MIKVATCLEKCAQIIDYSANSKKSFNRLSPDWCWIILAGIRGVIEHINITFYQISRMCSSHRRAKCGINQAWCRSRYSHGDSRFILISIEIDSRSILQWCWDPKSDRKCRGTDRDIREMINPIHRYHGFPQWSRNEHTSYPWISHRWMIWKKSLLQLINSWSSLSNRYSLYRLCETAQTPWLRIFLQSYLMNWSHYESQSLSLPLLNYIFTNHGMRRGSNKLKNSILSSVWRINERIHTSAHLTNVRQNQYHLKRQ